MNSLKYERLKLGNFFIDLIDEPRAHLSKNEADLLVDECTQVARKGFGTESLTRHDIEIHTLDLSCAVFIRNQERKTIGFAGSIVEKIEGKNVLHLKGSALLPEYQGNGLYSLLAPIRMLREAEKIGDKFFVGSRTQNPRIFEYLSVGMGFYPQIGEKIPEDISVLAEKYANVVKEKHSDFNPARPAAFNSKTFAVKMAYGRLNNVPDIYAGIAGHHEIGFCMYGNNPPIARNREVNDFMKANLDFQNGDAIILLGEFNRSSCLHSIGKVASRHPEFKCLEERF